MNWRKAWQIPPLWRDYISRRAESRSRNGVTSSAYDGGGRLSSGVGKKRKPACLVPAGAECESMNATIQALLDKAESSEYPAESAAFYAGAMRLLAADPDRARLDVAL